MIKNNFQIIELLDITSASDGRIDSITAACTDPDYLFDRATGAVATCAVPLVIVITPGALTTGVALFGLKASSVNITVVDDTVEVYNKTTSLSDLTDIYGYWDWYFSPLINKNQFADTSLPPYPSGTITITIDNDGLGVECSEVAIGRAKILGDTIFGTGIGAKSYGIKEVNETTGAVSLTKGISRKMKDFVVTVDTHKLAYISKLLNSIDSTEAVFVGDSGLEELIIFGYYQSYSLLMSNFTTSDLAIYAEEITL